MLTPRTRRMSMVARPRRAAHVRTNRQARCPAPRPDGRPHDHVQKGDAPMRMPMVGGHEGAGVVEAVGPAVTRVNVGDHVTCSFIPVCGKCRYCATGRQNLCDAGRNAETGLLATGQFRFHQNGEDFGGLCALGTLSQYAVVHEYSVVKVPGWIGFDVAALVACGVPTGWGSAVRAGDVRAGQTVVIYGAGGVGSNAVQGARFAGRRMWSWWTRWSSSERWRPWCSAPRTRSPPRRRRTSTSTRSPGAS
jgi:D-arabinose 1-dehydrogenase-like Zn-dependent alcohol dehydrogenase